MDGKRASVSMKASSTVMGFEALIDDVAAATEGGSGGWSKRALPEMRRVVRPGKRAGRWLRNVHDEILLRERSREESVGEKRKFGIVS